MASMVFLAKLRGSEACVMQGKHLPNNSPSGSFGINDDLRMWHDFTWNGRTCG